MILPGGVSYPEVVGASGVSKVCLVDVAGDSSHSDAWLLLWEDGVSVHPVQRRPLQTLRMDLSQISHHGNTLVLQFFKKHIRNHIQLVSLHMKVSNSLTGPERMRPESIKTQFRLIRSVYMQMTPAVDSLHWSFSRDWV